MISVFFVWRSFYGMRIEEQLEAEVQEVLGDVKFCPQCKREYVDATLQFCLDDGRPLVKELTEADPNATLVLSSEVPSTVASSPAEEDK
jgi:hypothetical protein